jgi:undecaprenyl-diphosphatase
VIPPPPPGPAGAPRRWRAPRRIVGSAVVASATAFVLLTIAVVAQAPPLVRLDATVSAAAFRLAAGNDAWHTAMLRLTHTADGTVLVPIDIAVVVLLLLRRRWRDALFVAVATAGTSGLRALIRDAVARPRPADQLAPAAGWAYPSGHTSSAATAALIVIFLCWPLVRHRWARAALVAAAAGWAVAIGVSRVALVVHWPSDVVGAWLLVLTVVPAIAMITYRVPHPPVPDDPPR